jgi:hypothetical protein
VPRATSKSEDLLLSAPDSKSGRLQRDCLKLLREHERDGSIPTNGRFLFYELEQRGVIPKKYDGINPTTGNSYKRTPLVLKRCAACGELFPAGSRRRGRLLPSTKQHEIRPWVASRDDFGDAEQRLRRRSREDRC